MASDPAGFNFIATGVGSVPFEDITDTCEGIVDAFPQIPFWPQFVKRSDLEDMIIQPSEGLPLLKIKEGDRALVIPEGEKESELVDFYDRFLADDVERFAVSREYAPGLFELLEILGRDGAPEGAYIKGQIVGPVTFATAIKDSEGRALLSDPELLDAVVNGLSIKALWQIRRLKASGRDPIIFLDEPSLSGFGSAFSPIDRKQVIELLGAVIDYLRKKSDALIGIHCCGNTDWAMLLEAGPDIINFDAYDYMDTFLLYREDVIQFLEKGGAVAWGIVPTGNLRGSESIDRLFAKLNAGLELIQEWGAKGEILKKNAILTPACGMGTMTEADALKSLDLLRGLSEKCQKELL